MHQRARRSRRKAASKSCVMNPSPQRETERRRNRRESTARDSNILWKTFFLSSVRQAGAAESRSSPDVDRSEIHYFAAGKIVGFSRPARRARCEKAAPKMKDPSGGTTGRVKAIWALGVD